MHEVCAHRAAIVKLWLAACAAPKLGVTYVKPKILCPVILSIFEYAEAAASAASGASHGEI